MLGFHFNVGVGPEDVLDINPLSRVLGLHLKHGHSDYGRCSAFSVCTALFMGIYGPLQAAVEDRGHTGGGACTVPQGGHPGGQGNGCARVRTLVFRV
jgi:hypothetical protein